jgi:hypothetical protein
MSDNSNPETTVIQTWKASLEKWFSILSKIIVAVFTWYSIQILEKINASTSQMHEIKSAQEIITHDMESNQKLMNFKIDRMQQDINKLFDEVEKINEKK